MKLLSPRRFRRVVLVLLILYWVSLLTVTHLPPSELPKTHVSDKVEHFAAYGLLTALLHLSLWPRKWSIPRLAWVVLLVAMAYGAFDELTQPFFKRSADIHDWYADTTGALIVIGIMSVVYRMSSSGSLTRNSGRGSDSHPGSHTSQVEPSPLPSPSVLGEGGKSSRD